MIDLETRSVLRILKGRGGKAALKPPCELAWRSLPVRFVSERSSRGGGCGRPPPAPPCPALLPRPRRPPPPPPASSGARGGRPGLAPRSRSSPRPLRLPPPPPLPPAPRSTRPAMEGRRRCPEVWRRGSGQRRAGETAAAGGRAEGEAAAPQTPIPRRRRRQVKGGGDNFGRRGGRGSGDRGRGTGAGRERGRGGEAGQRRSPWGCRRGAAGGGPGLPGEAPEPVFPCCVVLVGFLRPSTQRLEMSGEAEGPRRAEGAGGCPPAAGVGSGR